MANILDGITRFENFDRPWMPNPAPHSPPGLTSRTRLSVVGPDGKVKQTTPWVENIACTFGLASLASMVGSSAAVTASTLISAMKIGTSTTAAASTDAALVASTGSVTMGNASFTKTNTSARTVEYRATFASSNPAGAAEIHEIGMYCNSTGDNELACRTVLTGANSVNKGASDVIQVSYQLVFTTV